MATRKISVTVEEERVDAVQGRVGARGVSAFSSCPRNSGRRRARGDSASCSRTWRRSWVRLTRSCWPRPQLRSTAPSERAGLALHVGIGPEPVGDVPSAGQRGRERAGFARERGVAARRVQAIVTEEPARRNALVRIPAAVLAEVYRGSRRDAGVDGSSVEATASSSSTIGVSARRRRIAGPRRSGLVPPRRRVGRRDGDPTRRWRDRDSRSRGSPLTGARINATSSFTDLPEAGSFVAGKTLLARRASDRVRTPHEGTRRVRHLVPT